MCFRYVAVICYFILQSKNGSKEDFFQISLMSLNYDAIYPLEILHCPSFELFLIFKCFWKTIQMSSIYFHFLSNNSPRRRACSFIWRNKTHFKVKEITERFRALSLTYYIKIYLKWHEWKKLKLNEKC